jgi:hypothetical protein
MDLEDTEKIEHLLKVNIKLARENNKILKKMRRASLIRFWGRIVFFLLMSGLVYYAYQYYLHDYVIQMQDMYDSLQEGVDGVKAIPSRFGL